MLATSKVLLPTVLSVEALNSAYHFSLTNKQSKGELHDFYELVYVEEGFYYVILDGERFEVPPGSCIFFAPNVFHSGDGVTRSTATVGILSFDSVSPAMRYFDNRIFALEGREKELLTTTFADAFALCERRNGALCARDGVSASALQRLKGELELFLLSLYREEGEPCEPSNRKQYKKESFGRLSSYMKAHLGEHLSLPEIATACSMSETTVKVLCREFCGCGPIDYLIFLRITAAKTLIRQSDLSFTEIAERTGFGTLHYFSRVFKERVGMTPTAYAKAP